ncbi:TPA: hypothetical protein ACXDAB_003408 [Clostridium botulinum]
MARKSKPIPFTENENHLLEWAENRDKPFATYVKDLIREDMKKNNKFEKEELKAAIKEILKDMDINTIKKEEPKTNSKLSNKSKAAYKSLLKNINK